MSRRSASTRSSVLPRMWLIGCAREVRSDGPAPYPLQDLTIQEPDIESIVRRMYQEELRPRA
jgi:hypothetical protein